MKSTADHDTPIILFDGVCNLCTASVRFVIERDSRKRFRFASLQSPWAEKLLGPQPEGRDKLESMILIVDHRIYRKSTAALLTARRLDGLWPLLSLMLVIPRPLRDAVYEWVGHRRYRMFGKQEVCWKPQSDLADRFLD